MSFFIGKDRHARRGYGFDEISLVPGRLTINPDEVDIKWKLRDTVFDIPFIASAMDGVVDTKFAIQMNKRGGLAVLNLEGIYARYENPGEIVERIVNAKPDEATKIFQDIYREPIKEELIVKRIQEMKKTSGHAAVSAIPQRADKFGPLAQEAGCDVFVVQATVVTAKHESTKYKMLDFSKFCNQMKIPVIIGNCVGYDVALDLMDTGCDGILVGIGPGAACTTRGVLGIGVPQITATVDCAQARDFYYKRTGRYVNVITDGGMTTGGDVCKAFAAGADAVMLGSNFARAKEAPGNGYHWGMATPHQWLPRGTRVYVGTCGTLDEILFGPAQLDDGTQNLVGALKTSMGNLGVRNIREMQQVEIMIAPEIKSEGKLYQKAQKVGMGK